MYTTSIILQIFNIFLLASALIASIPTALAGPINIGKHQISNINLPRQAAAGGSSSVAAGPNLEGGVLSTSLTTDTDGSVAAIPEEANRSSRSFEHLGEGRREPATTSVESTTTTGTKGSEATSTKSFQRVGEENGNDNQQSTQPPIPKPIKSKAGQMQPQPTPPSQEKETPTPKPPTKIPTPPAPSPPLSSSLATTTSPTSPTSSNAALALSINRHFSTLTLTTPCNPQNLTSLNACIFKKHFVTCNPSTNTYSITASCAAPLGCFALPLENERGVSVACVLADEAASRMGLAGGAGELEKAISGDGDDGELLTTNMPSPTTSPSSPSSLPPSPTSSSSSSSTEKGIPGAPVVSGIPKGSRLLEKVTVVVTVTAKL